MVNRRHISVWLLLAAIVAGGVLGPTLHRVQHGVQRMADQPVAPCHTDGVHRADGPVWTDAASELGAPECDYCATRLLVVPPTPAPSTSPLVVGTTAVQPSSHVAAAHVERPRFIRGPPSLSEARPA